MSFVSLPHSFGDTQAKASAFQIARVGSAGLEPVGMLHLEEALPVEADKLAANLAALLNGNNPIYRFGENYQMFYEQHSSGMTFRFRPKSDDAGVSKVGALFILLPGIEMEFSDAHRD